MWWVVGAILYIVFWIPMMIVALCVVEVTVTVVRDSREWRRRLELDDKIQEIERHEFGT